MADYHQIVDEIRGFLQASDQTRNERLEGLASAYAEACIEVNQRLGRCQRLVQKGLRSEAIQLAESEPKVLDAIAALDFPERAEWDELVGIYELAPAPRVLVEAGGVLHEAYAQEEPLQDLLNNHRRLAMRRAPLRARIGVMRKLATRDPTNPIWGEDLRTIEKARSRQIQAETAEAVRLHDGPHIKRLLAEVQESTWIEPPSKGLIQGLIKADAQLRTEQTQAAMAEIEARFHEALTARDPIRGRAARQEWIALTAAGPLEPSDPIWERIGPVLGWLEDEDRRAAAALAYEGCLAALTQALDEPGPVPAAELERLGQAVLKSGRGMPDKLRRRYTSRLRAATAVRTRRSRMIAVAAAAAMLMGGGMVFSLVRDHFRASDAAQAATTIDEMLEANDLDRAAGFLENLKSVDPDLLSDPSLAEARDRYDESRKQETERVQRFEGAINEAEHAPLTTTEPKALEAARALARRESEKQSVEGITRRRRAALQEERDKREAILKPKLNALGQEIHQIGQRLGAIPSDLTPIRETIDRSRLALDRLSPDVAIADEELRSVARVLEQQLERVSDRLDLLRRRDHLREAITDAVAYSVADKPDAIGLFSSRLQGYLKAYPDEPCSRAFRRILEERPLWETVAAWNRLAAGWTMPRHGLPFPEAELRAGSCGQFLRQHPDFPGTADIIKYKMYVDAIARRVRGDVNPARKLQKVLSKPVVDHLWMVVVKEGNHGQLERRYYAIEKPKESGGFVQFTCMVDFAGKKQDQVIPSRQVTSKDLSPQSEIARQFKPMLAGPSKLSHWEAVVIELVNAIVHQTDLDPILQVELLRAVVEAAMEGSEPLRVSLAALKDQLDQGQANRNVAWIDPRVAGLAEAQDEGRRFMQTIRAQVPTVEKVLDLRDQFERAVSKTYRTVGWLAQGRDGYEVRTGTVVPREGDLWIIAPTSNQRAEWRKVGIIDGAQSKIDTHDRSSLLEGRPVFVIQRTW